MLRNRPSNVLSVHPVSFSGRSATPAHTASPGYCSTEEVNDRVQLLGALPCAEGDTRKLSFVLAFLIMYTWVGAVGENTAQLCPFGPKSQRWFVTGAPENIRYRLSTPPCNACTALISGPTSNRSHTRSALRGTNGIQTAYSSSLASVELCPLQDNNHCLLLNVAIIMPSFSILTNVVVPDCQTAHFRPPSSTSCPSDQLRYWSVPCLCKHCCAPTWSNDSGERRVLHDTA